MDFEKKRARPTENGIRSIRTPTGYGSSLDKSFTVDGHIPGFKTHDFHNFLKVLYHHLSFTGNIDLVINIF